MSNAVLPNKKISRYKFILLLALFALPFAFSYIAYYVWKPAGQGSNYGQLLPVRALPDITGTTLDGKPFNLSQLKGKWVMLQLDSGACNAYCQTKQYDMRQVRVAQGRERDRIERVWLVTDKQPVDAALLNQYSGTSVIRVDADAVRQFAAGASPEDAVYLIDPLGNLMLRFPKNPDPRGMIKDIKQLLKASQIG
jgi:cytochrome oxidase Cu insertion factor (SCO1/SenC/PrrC family)